jgi:long-subunit fatty acid transport protein
VRHAKAFGPLALSALLAFASGAPVTLAAQASQFGIRGLGYPNAAYSARARAMGGGSALFDAQSALNPAALGTLAEMTAAFSIINDRRRVVGPAGDGTVSGMRFPLFSIAGPVRGAPLTVALGASTMLARDFSATFTDTAVIRGVPTEMVDTLSAEGGLNDLRAALAWRINQRTVVGASFHIYTGVTRLGRVRTFQDSGYVSVSERSEVSAAGTGFDLGIIRRVAPLVTVAALLRVDGSANVRRDSLEATAYDVDLPVSLAIGAQARPTPRLLLGAQYRWAGWSSASEALSGPGSTGAVDTWEMGLGGEYVRDLERPYRLPVRFGFRRAALPFPLVDGDDPTETVASLGTGFLFAQGMGGADLALERVWRSDGGDFRERGWLFTMTATLRPNRRSR